jgi:hypothetical protein
VCHDAGVSDLEVTRIVDEAVTQTGLSDFGPDSWQEGLGQLVDSLNGEAALTELGSAVAAGELTGYLVDRLQIIDYRKANPEVADRDVTPPIFIIGQGRTGTTILFDLMAQDPASRVPVTWEVDKPIPPADPATFETDPRIAEVDATLAGVDLVLPGFRAMHPMGAQLPQECVRITASDFRSMIFATQYRVPSYTRWLIDEADMRPAYAWHRMFLQHLQANFPSERWVLKSPGHIWCLDALVAEYPNAFFVQTHRDPLRIVGSIASLVARLRTLASDTPSIPEVAPEFGDYILSGLDRSVTARENGTVATGSVIDLQFAEFMSDPFATIGKIYAAAGFDYTAAAEARMREHLADNPQDKHGKHTYTWTETQLDLDEWRERSRHYQEYFDVPSESLG